MLILNYAIQNHLHSARDDDKQDSQTNSDMHTEEGTNGVKCHKTAITKESGEKDGNTKPDTEGSYANPTG